jgi:hypothetical protein
VYQDSEWCVTRHGEGDKNAAPITPPGTCYTTILHVPVPCYRWRAAARHIISAKLAPFLVDTDGHTVPGNTQHLDHAGGYFALYK